MNYKRIIDRIIDTGLVFLVVFTPLAFGSVHIWAYTLMELTVFSLLIIWALKVLFLSRLKIDTGLIPVYLSFFIFLLIVYLQTVALPPAAVRSLSPEAYRLYSLVIPGYEKAAVTGNYWRSLSIYAYATKTGLIKFISYTGIFFLITHEIREEKRIRRIIFALVLAGAFEALYGLYGYFNKDPYIFGFRKIYDVDSATGTYVNRNHFAGFLGIVTPVGIGYLLYLLSRASGRTRDGYGLKQHLIDFFATPKAIEGGLVLIMVITMIAGISLSLSRMGVFSFIVAVLFMLFISVLNRQKKLASIFFVIVALGFITSLWYGLAPLKGRYHETSKNFAEGRLPVWKATTRLIKDFPLTGTGIGTYETVFQRYTPRGYAGGPLRYKHAHNDYLEMLSEAGIIGIVPVGFGSAYFLILIIKKWVRNRNTFARGLCLGGIGSAVYILLHSTTDFNMHIPANALTSFIVMALTYCSVTVKRTGAE